MNYSFTHYLAAKKSVDDRALNRPVLDTMAAALPRTTPARPLQVLELGAGIGTMLERLIEWQVLAHCHYLGIDSEQENILHARQRLPAWAAAQGFQTRLSDQSSALHLSRPERAVTAAFEHLDLFELLARPEFQGAFDLLIANAFLDLIDLPTALPEIIRLLKPGGVFYFTLNFDGETIFEPVEDSALEAEIIAAYHLSMDMRGAGDSRTGRRLFAELVHAGGHLLNVGASDWVVFPSGGAYPQDEAYFLHHILSFFEESLHDRVPSDRLQAWLVRRRAEIDRASLVYIAHQLDFVGIREE